MLNAVNYSAVQLRDSDLFAPPQGKLRLPYEP